MKILLTGGSSLTGIWFARQLRAEGHQVLCTLTQGSLDAYRELKSSDRVRLLTQEFDVLFGIEFGSKIFCDLLRREKFDIACLHGAHIPDYRSPEFNIAESMYRNLFNINEVFSCLADRPTPFVITGTFFEPGEGDHGENTEAVSPYGFAKHLIARAFEYYAKKFGVPMARFIIPNPFGPLEDKKFTAYLIDCWKKGQVALVKTPLYIRDNIHAQLLAFAYAELVTKRAQDSAELMISRPSGYCESQGQFAARFSMEMERRLQISCRFELGNQNEFLEPRTRTNSESVLSRYPNFSEEKAWDELADYYR